MRAILTKYLPYTNTKPSRIKAYSGNGKHLLSHTVSIHSLPETHDEDRHKHAAYLLAYKYNWNGSLIGGETPEGYAFVFTK